MRKLSNRGQVDSIGPAVLALTLAGVVLVFGLIILNSFTSTTSGDDTSGRFTNQTVTMTNTTGITSEITQSNDCGYSSWNATQVMNASVQLSVMTYLVDYGVHANGSVYNLTHPWDPSVLVSGTYTWGGEACRGSNLTEYGIGKFAEFWEILVLAVVISAVIGLLLVVFGGKRSR